MKRKPFQHAAATVAAEIATAQTFAHYGVQLAETRDAAYRADAQLRVSYDRMFEAALRGDAPAAMACESEYRAAEAVSRQAGNAHRLKAQEAELALSSIPHPGAP